MNWLKKQRSLQHLSIKKLAKKSGVSELAISNIELGLRVPTVVVCEKLMDAGVEIPKNICKSLRPHVPTHCKMIELEWHELQELAKVSNIKNQIEEGD